jgi:multidrug efflux pump subunit AcrA (membrane-fusion protein)
MFVQVQVHVDARDPMVSIPEEAQRPSGDVWVMRDGRLEVLRPRAVQATGGRLIFDVATSGLLPGDRIVVSQIASPRPGMAVAEAGQPAPQRVAAESEGDAS